MPLRRLLATAAVSLAAATGLTACTGQPEDTNVHVGETEGVYVSAGELKYQVQISRVLNQFDREDSQYLDGLTPLDRTIPGDEDWFGVFIRVFNQTETPHRAASEFVIHDTTGAEYRPLTINPRENGVAYVAGPVPALSQLPLDDTLGRVNTTQGGVLLFKIPSASFEARPFELHITDPEGGEGGEIVLDI